MPPWTPEGAAVGSWTSEEGIVQGLACLLMEEGPAFAFLLESGDAVIILDFAPMFPDGLTGDWSDETAGAGAWSAETGAAGGWGSEVPL